MSGSIALIVFHLLHLPLQETARLEVFQQDSVPTYRGLDVWRFLNETFPDRQARRDDPICWPLRSPHITLLDFFPSYMKDKGYQNKV